jgi:hypothetical protein
VDGLLDEEASSLNDCPPPRIDAACALEPLFSRLSSGVAGEEPVTADLEKSKAVPGVFGVLLAEPNDANAPEPSPNAEEAPAVGDVMPEVLKGAIAMKGFDDRPSPPPNRLEPDNTRDEWSLRLSLWSLPESGGGCLLLRGRG